MKLRQFRVKGFRCIHDSGDVPVRDLAALIGKNESGKTALLQALRHLNREEPINYLDRCDQMWETFEQTPNLRVVEGRFVLDQEEIQAIQSSIAGAPRISEILIFRPIEGEVQYEFPGAVFGTREQATPDALQLFKTLLSQIASAVLPKTTTTSSPLVEAEILKSTLDDLAQPASPGMAPMAVRVQQLAQLITPSESTDPLLKDLANIVHSGFSTVSLRNDVEEYIATRLHPRLVYFSEYKNINGAIKIAQYLSAKPSTLEESLGTGEPLDKKETIDNLFFLAGLDPTKLEGMKNSPALKNKYLGECGARLTKALRPTWRTQSIDVDFVYDAGDVLWVKVTDVHADGSRTNEGMLSRRAAGFIWHFSFFVNFTAETQKSALKNAILLLDEPALYLHPAQQAGTLEVLKDLARENQILYSTHSPFMIFDYTVGHLLTVELDPESHLSTIRATYWDSDPETLIPILHALGAPDVFGDATRVAVRRPVIIVEGITDYQYITAILDLLSLRKPTKQAMLWSANILPANTSSAIAPLALYHRAKGRETVVVYDLEPDAQAHAETLKKLGFPPEKIVFAEFDKKPQSDIEDLFTQSEYLQVVNELYREVLKDSKFSAISDDDLRAKKDKKANARIVPSLEAVWQERKGWGNFDKKKVCEKLCNKMYDDPKFLSEEALGRFEKLFDRIAGALKPKSKAAPADPIQA